MAGATIAGPWFGVSATGSINLGDKPENVTGIIIDYIGDSNNRIYGGHPLDADAKLYDSGNPARQLP